MVVFVWTNLVQSNSWSFNFSCQFYPSWQNYMSRITWFEKNIVISLFFLFGLFREKCRNHYFRSTTFSIKQFLILIPGLFAYPPPSISNTSKKVSHASKEWENGILHPEKLFPNRRSLCAVRTKVYFYKNIIAYSNPQNRAQLRFLIALWNNLQEYDCVHIDPWIPPTT